MTTANFMAKLMGYFSGKYTAEIMGAIEKFIGQIDDADKDRIFDYLVENREKMTVCSVAEIRGAAREQGIAFRQQTNAEIISIDCPACGLVYKYAQAVNDWERLEMATHARCPKCGMPGHSMFLAKQYASMQEGKMPEWFERDCEHFRNYEYKDINGASIPYYKAEILRREMAEEARLKIVVDKPRERVDTHWQEDL